MTALTPAQVRDHARALILRCGSEPTWNEIRDYVDENLFNPFDGAEGQRDMTSNLEHAIRTARITVDWDEETK